MEKINIFIRLKPTKENKSDFFNIFNLKIKSLYNNIIIKEKKFKK